MPPRRKTDHDDACTSPPIASTRGRRLSPCRRNARCDSRSPGGVQRTNQFDVGARSGRHQVPGCSAESESAAKERRSAGRQRRFGGESRHRRARHVCSPSAEIALRRGRGRIEADANASIGLASGRIAWTPSSCDRNLTWRFHPLRGGQMRASALHPAPLAPDRSKSRRRSNSETTQRALNPIRSERVGRDASIAPRPRQALAREWPNSPRGIISPLSLKPERNSRPLRQGCVRPNLGSRKGWTRQRFDFVRQTRATGIARARRTSRRRRLTSREPGSLFPESG